MGNSAWKLKELLLNVIQRAQTLVGNELDYLCRQRKEDIDIIEYERLKGIELKLEELKQRILRFNN